MNSILGRIISRTPLLTMIAVTLLAYLLPKWHAQEKAGIQQVLDVYVTSGLFEFEKEHYLDFHLRSVQLDFSHQETDYSQLVDTLGSHELDTSPSVILHDYRFVSDLRASGSQFILNQDHSTWVRDRQKLLALKNDLLPSYRYGIVLVDGDLHQLPSDSAPLHKMISSAWLELGQSNLIIILAVLFIALGILELRLGKTAAIVTVTTCLVITSQTYQFFTSNVVPLYSGLFSNTLVLLSFALILATKSSSIQALQTPLRVLCYLLMISGWLAFAGAYYHLADNFSFMQLISTAVACGIVSVISALTAYVFGSSSNALKVSENSKHSEVDEEHRQLLAQAFSALETFDFDHACKLFDDICKRYPEDRVSAQQRYYLAAAQRDPDLDQHIEHLSNALIANKDHSRALILLKQLKLHAQSEGYGLNPVTSYTKLFKLFLEVGQLKSAEQCFHLLYQSDAEHNLVNEAGFLLHSAFQKRGMRQKAQEFIRFTDLDQLPNVL